LVKRKRSEAMDAYFFFFVIYAGCVLAAYTYSMFFNPIGVRYKRRTPLFLGRNL
jgi:hypothetical protein